MWRNPITDKQIRVLTEDWGVREDLGMAGGVRPVTGWFQVLTVSHLQLQPISDQLLTFPLFVLA
jgi:hypothetical protein